MRKYRPSNGTEGMCFIAEYCENCIHEKFMYTNNEKDKKCNILSNTMIYDFEDDDDVKNEPDYYSCHGCMKTVGSRPMGCMCPYCGSIMEEGYY